MISYSVRFLRLRCFIVFAALLLLWIPTQLRGQGLWQRQMKSINSNIKSPFEIDDERVKAAGIRKLSGKYITLYTDVPEDPMIEELTTVFENAIPQWCEAFQVPAEITRGWKLRGFLISDSDQLEKFRIAGLLPAQLPDFKAGYQQDHNLWFFLQPGQYYTRHLLLHEGTHAFMQWFRNGYGPAWYSEGMAELYGVHQWKDEQLKLAHRLGSRSEADYWGRVKRIKDESVPSKRLTLTDILAIPPAAFKDVRYYAWTWAGCKFLREHPYSKNEFANLNDRCHWEYTKFNRFLMSNLKQHWPDLERDWLIYINEMEYGFEVKRSALEPIKKLESNDPARSLYKLKVDHGWQRTEIRMRKGDRIWISASGRFQVGQSNEQGKTTPWPCEANGITLEYYRGRPLGILLAGNLDPDKTAPDDQVRGLLNPVSIGNGSEFTATNDGFLCLRINESPSRMDDNDGTLEVSVEKLR